MRLIYGMTCLSDCPYGAAIYRSMPWLMARQWHADLALPGEATSRDTG